MGKFNHREKLLLDYLPNGSGEKTLLIAKIKKYRSECGCSMGTKFLVAAIVVAVLYFVVFGGGRLPNILWNGLASLIFIFISAGLGKLAGIGIARFRLGILLRSAYKKFLNP